MADFEFLGHVARLQPPCSLDRLSAVEADLNYRFPSEYREFLLVADGGMPTRGIILYSTGPGIHPAETIEMANTGRNDLPVVFVGRFAEEEFGFLRTDTSDPHRTVYVYEHETGRTKRLADSFVAFLREEAHRQGLG